MVLNIINILAHETLILQISMECLSTNKRKRKTRQIPRPCKRAEEIMEHEGCSNTNCSWTPWNSQKEVRIETGRSRLSRSQHC